MTKNYEYYTKKQKSVYAYLSEAKNDVSYTEIAGQKIPMYWDYSHAAFLKVASHPEYCWYPVVEVYMVIMDMVVDGELFLNVQDSDFYHKEVEK